MMRRLIRNGYRLEAIAALLAVAFLFAQAAIVVHDVDPESYEADHACEICIPASVFSGGNVAVFADTQVAPFDHSIEPASVSAFSSTTTGPAQARAPPAAS